MRLALSTLALLAATPALALDCAEGERAFTHAAGETCIPESPQRIVATRHDSIATPLIELGAPLVGVGVAFDSGTGDIFIRGATDIFGVNVSPASDLISIGNANEPDLEVIAMLEPDLILIPDWQTELLDQLELIAPTVVVQGNLPFFDHLAFLAEATAMEDSYQQQLAHYDNRIAKARDMIGTPEAIVVSTFDMWDDGLWYYPDIGALEQVIGDLGFERPPIQAEATENISGLSFEHITEFDADVLLASHAVRFGQTIGMLTEQWDAVAPFWRDLRGVRTGNLFWYERDVVGGQTFASLDRAIDTLTVITAGRDFQ